MAEFYIYWRAQVKESTANPEGRFQRVVDELAAYPKIVAPVFDVQGDDRVGFGFSVDGFDSPLIARGWAERALRKSLHHGRVGDPEVLDGAAVTVRLWLEDHPTVCPMTD